MDVSKEEIKRLVDNLVGLTEFELEAKLVDCVLLERVEINLPTEKENFKSNNIQATGIPEFLFLARKMAAHPDWGMWRGFNFIGDKLKCNFCYFKCDFNATKRWANLVQHLARQHPFEIKNCRGLPPCEQVAWLKRLSA